MKKSEPPKSSKPKAPLQGLEVRLWAARALQKVLDEQSFIDTALKDAQPNQPDQKDISLANYLVSFALRHKGQLDEVFKQLLTRGVPKRSGLLEAILRISLVEIIYLDRAQHSAVHVAVEACKQDRRARSFAALANGVLRNAVRRKQEFLELSRAVNVPGWLAKRWVQNYGQAAFEQMVEMLMQRPPLDLVFKHGTDSTLEGMELHVLDQHASRLPALDRPVSQLPAYQEGHWWVQDIAAGLAARLFTLSQGASIADLCAAPGGKTLQLADAGYDVHAYDISSHRLTRLKENLARTKLTAHIEAADMLAHPFETEFDGVLLDAPCSATGTYRRHPELVWHRENKDITARSKLQRDMLKKAAQLVRAQGQLMYCTCSLEPEEGEAQLDWFLKTHTEFELLPINKGEVGLLADFVTSNGAVRIVPGMHKNAAHEGALDGFYICRLVKKTDTGTH